VEIEKIGQMDITNGSGMDIGLLDKRKSKMRQITFFLGFGWWSGSIIIV
jgi:hypothetical protein